ncbi:hypothetical protein L1987_15659 [Smallanthus sonchifolius]|uniref:Uncharacterized protein n=1 Tax=Smallanthus sonchifolius TaxID=185202 RepID=A0ACB9J8V2_9ASTR|nr:hypothetical protein L1987_15659 [Smallanthus sonchifolius]
MGGINHTANDINMHIAEIAEGPIEERGNALAYRLKKDRGSKESEDCQKPFEGLKMSMVTMTRVWKFL